MAGEEKTTEGEGKRDTWQEEAAGPRGPGAGSDRGRHYGDGFYGPHTDLGENGWL